MMVKPTTFAIFCAMAVGPIVPAAANGNGAGAGGSGHQRAINSGLPAGEPGPPGAPNNRRPPPPAPGSQPAAPQPAPPPN